MEALLQQSVALSPVAILQGYRFDESTRCWVPTEERPTFAYSDGEEVERRILRILSSAQDLRSVSLELRAQITDWPSRYHLSPCRGNLLRPIASLFQGNVLEIGAGCGAITRFLGECAGNVLALEGNPLRATAAAERCRDLDNVTVIADAFHKLQPRSKFDVVTLIGVLEYARQYFPAVQGDPVDALLAHAKKFLKPGGTLVLAIENQLGLKYFAGFGEDHVGEPMFGIEDRYHANSVVTFGKTELQSRLANADLDVQHWWYPFPDYKLPTVIVSEEMVRHADKIDLGPVIGPAVASDAQTPRHPLFLQERVWRPILRNQLVGELANSFLICASDRDTTPERASLAYHYAVERKPEYAKRVVFEAKKNGTLWARQEALFPAAQPADALPLRLHLEDQAFISGTHWMDRLKSIMTSNGWSVSDVENWASLWFDAVLKRADLLEKKGHLAASQVMPGTLLDALPRNLILTPDGKAEFIDQEWRLSFPIELGFLVFRGVYLSLLSVGKVAAPAPKTPLAAMALFTQVAHRLGLWIVEADLARYCDFENTIQAWVSGTGSLSVDNIMAFQLDRHHPPQLSTTQAEQLALARQTVEAREHLIAVLNEKISALGHTIAGLTQERETREERMVQLSQALEAHQTAEAESARNAQATEQVLAQKTQEYEKDILTLTQERQALQSEVAQLEQDLMACEAQLRQAMQTLAEHAQQYVALNDVVIERDTHIAQLSQRLLERDRQVVDIDQQRGEREEDIVRLAEVIQALGQHSAALLEELTANDTSIAHLRAQLTHSHETVQERDAQVMRMEQTLHQSHAERQTVEERCQVLERKTEQLQRELQQLSDWAARIHSRPLTYAFKKNTYRWARSLWRVLPITPGNKHRLKNSVTRLLRIGRPRAAPVAEERGCLPDTVHLPPLVTRSERDVLVFSVIDWHFRIQRPQHLARGFAKTGRRVFFLSNHFVDEDRPGYHLEQLDPGLALYQIKLHVRGAPPIYFAPPSDETIAMLQASLARLLADFGALSSISLVQHAFWYPLVQRLPNSYRIYDCMDHHEGFGNVDSQLIDIEKRMLRQSDLVVVTSAWLETFAKEHNRNVAMVRNAAEFTHFAKRPPEVFKDPQGRKIIGYYGAIAEWFDLELMQALAARYPADLFLLVGNDSVQAQAALAGHPNIVFTGEVPYDKLPYYVHAFDVCLLPFQVIPLTLATNPVKVYEYLSAGKPVVAVDLPEIAQFGELVYKASTREAFVRQVEQALRGTTDKKRMQARQQFGGQQTWDHRIAALNTALKQLELPKISAIVLTYNNLALTQACLSSLLEQSDYPNLEIIVVDNASTDETPRYLTEFKKEHPEVQVILNEKNIGFSAGNNVGLAAATGDYLVILNNDTVVTKGWAMTLMRHVQNDPTIGLIGPVTNNIGNEARLPMQYQDLAHMPDEAFRHTLANMGQTFPIANIAFFCAMLPRATYEHCGPLCEDYGLGFFEDDDYCRRVENAGLRIVCAEDVFIHHHLSASFNKLKSQDKQALFERNKRIYEQKWGAWKPHVYRAPSSG